MHCVFSLSFLVEELLVVGCWEDATGIFGSLNLCSFVNCVFATGVGEVMFEATGLK